MNLRELVQTLHLEARLPGNPPSGVEGLSGRAADLVRWVQQAWGDIQREKGGRWRWMLAEFRLTTTQDQASYGFDACTDLETSAAITRFRAWHLVPHQGPMIFKVSEGRKSQRELHIADWDLFRYQYVRGEHTADYPHTVAEDPRRKLYLAPTPNDAFQVDGYYWRSNQELEGEDDEPEMPSDFHLLIVYRAIVKYGYNAVAADILARAQAEGMPLWDALVDNQSYAGTRLKWPGPLA